MTTKTRPRKTAKTTEERRAEVTALRDQLAEYETDLDPGIIAAITARHDGYSERNARLIAMQRPDATDVAGFRAWQDRGRKVRKGEKGIKILAPMSGVRQVENPAGESKDQAWLAFRLAYVFDIAQTDEVTP